MRVAALLALVLALAGCGHGGEGSAAASKPVEVRPVSADEWKAVLRDWYDHGRVARRHRCAAVRAAIAHLPVDPRTYNTAYDDLQAYAGTVCDTREYVAVPSNHGRTLEQALRRLHDAGLGATFGGVSTPCGDGLPVVAVQEPRAPERVPPGTVVRLRFEPSPVPSPAVPLRHRPATTVPRLTGGGFGRVERLLRAAWPCVHVRGAEATAGTSLVVVAQSPAAGTTVPAYGVRSGRGFRPTTVDLTFSAR